MKHFIFGISLLFLTTSIQAQEVISGKSKPKRIQLTIPKPSFVTALPDLIIAGETFSDQDKNNFIDADEFSEIRFNVENIGKGVAENVMVRVSLKNEDIRGLSFGKEIPVGDIPADTKKEVSVPITASIDLEDQIAEFIIEVREERGFDAFPLEIKIETKKFRTPEVIIADAVFSTEDGGLIKLNYPINLKVIVQNIGDGDATGVVTEFLLTNPNCVFLGEHNRYELGRLEVGETQELEFLFTATRRYIGSEIPVYVDVTEQYNKYSRDTALNVGLQQRLTARNQVVISGIVTASQEVKIASLSADVDKNIPVNNYKNQNRYALIIGNEDYSKYQRGISTESNVQFARNDAKIFKDYAVNTLGVENSNVYLLIDATAGEIQQKIDLVSKLATKTGTQAEIIFYYAGHGLPDESTKEPYLIPVDVSGSNLSSAVKLGDIYASFSKTGAKRITVFLDACFSGGGRNAMLIAARSVKVVPKQQLIDGNMVVFCSSSSEQSALPYVDKQHGLFTYYLLKKLQYSKGDVSYGELADYLTQKVSLESLKINQKEQDPQVKFSLQVKKDWENWRFDE